MPSAVSWRKNWENLNGTWDLRVGEEHHTIVVPFAPESQLSGVGKHFPEGSILCYRRNFSADTARTGRFLLHFGAVSQHAEIYVNQTGNPGMAVGGSGDVLSGIIVSLLGQGIEPLKAAACGAWLHGKAGDICAERIGQYGMLPTDMVEVLPRLLK